MAPFHSLLFDKQNIRILFYSSYFIRMLNFTYFNISVTDQSITQTRKTNSVESFWCPFVRDIPMAIFIWTVKTIKWKLLQPLVLLGYEKIKAPNPIESTTEYHYLRFRKLHIHEIPVSESHEIRQESKYYYSTSQRKKSETCKNILKYA